MLDATMADVNIVSIFFALYSKQLIFMFVRATLFQLIFINLFVSSVTIRFFFCSFGVADRDVGLEVWAYALCIHYGN